MKLSAMSKDMDFCLNELNKMMDFIEQRKNVVNTTEETVRVDIKDEDDIILVKKNTEYVT